MGQGLGVMGHAFYKYSKCLFRVSYQSHTYKGPGSMCYGSRGMGSLSHYLANMGREVPENGRFF